MDTKDSYGTHWTFLLASLSHRPVFQNSWQHQGSICPVLRIWKGLGKENLAVWQWLLFSEHITGLQHCNSGKRVCLQI